MSTRFLSRAGLIGLVAGLVGALIALVLLFWPAQVVEGPVSYPFTTTGFLIAQAIFFVHHFGLLAPLVALAASPITGAHLLFRAGAWIAVLGMGLLTACELLAMRYADWDFDTANAGLMGTSYGISCTVIGLGMLLAGVGVLRTGLWTGWRRWTPLAIGIAEFVILTPGMFGGFVAARLAIGFWMLLFGALGWAMYVEARGVVTSQPSQAVAVG